MSMLIFAQLIDTQVHSDYQSELKYLVTNKERIEYLSKLLHKVQSWHYSDPSR